MAKRFTLAKNERLKSRKRIEQLFNEGKRLTVFPYRISYLYNDRGIIFDHKASCLQFGTGVGTKNFRKAADRNRIKRLTREAWRLKKNELKERLLERKKCLHVFFIYTAKELPDYDLVSAKMTVALNKLAKIIDENNPADT